MASPLVVPRSDDECEFGVLLAGDAAHIHTPLGGQGMNLGLADAGNLAWKLAAVIHGWASPKLLDSYHAERHPIGQRVVEDTRVQTALVTATTPDGKALRARFNEILADHPSLNRELAERLSGVDLAYPPLAMGIRWWGAECLTSPSSTRRYRACSACCDECGSCCWI
ncbi:MAG TPA: FAD-dependent monooxygenase [Pseudonocardiaceae bacterium]|nr:FAD-dependent monooxygenase [Pseudonocardiaceae bacterium]